jgi:hypothetical protein
LLNSFIVRIQEKFWSAVFTLRHEKVRIISVYRSRYEAEDICENWYDGLPKGWKASGTSRPVVFQSESPAEVQLVRAKSDLLCRLGL